LSWPKRARPGIGEPDVQVVAAEPLLWLSARAWLSVGVATVGAVIVVANLLLLAPQADRPVCATTTRIGQGLGYPLNCDSPLFMQLALHPRELLKPDNRR